MPTKSQLRPFQDDLAEQMMVALETERGASRHPLLFTRKTASRASCTSIGPETGLTQPGMTICCGDSHTSTHGAFGAIAFGIGTSQVRDVLATQTSGHGAS